MTSTGKLVLAGLVLLERRVCARLNRERRSANVKDLFELVIIRLAERFKRASTSEERSEAFHALYGELKRVVGEDIAHDIVDAALRQAEAEDVVAAEGKGNRYSYRDRYPNSSSAHAKQLRSFLDRAGLTTDRVESLSLHEFSRRQVLSWRRGETFPSIQQQHADCAGERSPHVPAPRAGSPGPPSSHRRPCNDAEIEQ